MDFWNWSRYISYSRYHKPVACSTTKAIERRKTCCRTNSNTQTGVLYIVASLLVQVTTNIRVHRKEIGGWKMEISIQIIFGFHPDTFLNWFYKYCENIYNIVNWCTTSTLLSTFVRWNASAANTVLWIHSRKRIPTLMKSRRLTCWTAYYGQHIAGALAEK